MNETAAVDGLLPDCSGKLEKRDYSKVVLSGKTERLAQWTKINLRIIPLLEVIDAIRPQYLYRGVCHQLDKLEVILQ